jgi:hypothetical protein
MRRRLVIYSHVQKNQNVLIILLFMVLITFKRIIIIVRSSDFLLLYYVGLLAHKSLHGFKNSNVHNI